MTIVDIILLIGFAVLITALIGMVPCLLMLVAQYILRLLAHSEYEHDDGAYVLQAGRQIKAH